MSQGQKKARLFGVCLLCLLLMGGASLIHGYMDYKNADVNKNTYFTLPADTCKEDPLLYLSEDFEVLEGFHSNMPIVILSMDEELKDYKSFLDSQEYLTDVEDPYVSGHISIIDNGGSDNCISDMPILESDLKLKKRGHTSYYFDKEQYLLKLLNEDGTDNDVDMLGMGAHHTWILNGSMADKSMIRNYLAYRIASEVSEVTPDSQYCEVLLEQDGKLYYQGLYLMMESIARDVNRINIDKYSQKNTYTSYIIRRDRFTHFDPMLDTWGRLSGLSEEWIGVKYPTAAQLDDRAKQYIEQDFSKIEQVIYSEDERVFMTYDKYIDVDSFADYFLFNEFFGNYDAGEHSTYMYKNSGEVLKIGPVWDFDQAMNNYYDDEMKPETLAFQEKPFFDRLVLDQRFLEVLEARYAELRKGTLSEEHVDAVIDEVVDYITSAREREWFRWAADYEDSSGENWHNYYLLDYQEGDMVISRFNDNYDQEIYNIKTYLHKHGNSLATELVKLEKSSVYNTSLGNRRELFLMLIMILFFVPAIMLIRRE